MNRVVSVLSLYFLTCIALSYAAPPIAPTGVEASDAAFGNKVTISWEHVRDAQIYRVYRSTANDPATAQSIGVTESVIYNDSTGPKESYFYWVQAIGTDGVSPFSTADPGSTATGTGPFGIITINGLPVAGAPAAPSANQTTGAKVYLGKTLFWDEQLSSTRTTACGTCHRFSSGGTDPRAGKGAPNSTNPGLDGIIKTDDDIAGSRGVPLTVADGSYRWSSKYGVREQITDRRPNTVLDAAFAAQGVLWDGKPGTILNDPDTGKPILTTSASLEAQALLPVLNSIEMAHDGRTLGDVVARIRDSKPLALSPSIPPALARWIDGRTYDDLFADAFGSPGVTAIRFAEAIASYERTLFADRTPLDGPFTQTLNNGFSVFTRSVCTACHNPPVSTDGNFLVTGVRPPAEDPGRGGITGLASQMGAFKVPTIRNAGLRTGMFHNGNTTVEGAIEFYNRGGDFKESAGFQSNLIKPLNLSAADKQNLASFLRYQLTDQRVASESGPLFDRPWLYSESARMPVITGSGLEAGGVVPQPIALEPAFLGNPSFTIAVDSVPAGASAVLLIDHTDPGATSVIPDSPGVIRRAVTTSDSGSGKGYASATMALPSDSAMAGTTLYGRWYVTTGSGVAVSPAVRFTIFNPVPATETLTTLSAASLVKGRVARDSIVSSFGSGLAASTVTSQGDLPTTLGGVRVSITDSQGAKLDAPLYFVSPGQINYVVPAQAAEGEAKVEVIRDGSTVASGLVQIAGVAPGIFTGNSNGRDAAAALIQRVSAGGSSSTFQSTKFDTNLQLVVPLAVDLGPDTDQLFLQLYGTGVRNAQGLKATIGGLPADVLFSGAQSQFPGMDQVNLRIPRELAGKGEVEVILTAGDVRSNIVRIAVQ